MKIYALISEGYSDAVGYENGKLVHWSKTDFAKDENTIHELVSNGKASSISHLSSPLFIRSLGELLSEAGVPFRTFQMELSPKEIAHLQKFKTKNLQLA